MGINLAQLQYLIALVDSGTMQRAAERSHVSQPSISRAISSLESELGVSLFVRQGRRLVATEAATEVVAIARRICVDVERLIDVGGRRETISVAATPSVEALFTDLTIRCSLTPPRGAQLEFVPGDSASEVEQLVKSGTADVGLLEHPPQLQLRSRRICDIETVIVASPELGLTNPIPVDMLSEVSLVLPRSGTRRRREIDAYLAELGVTPTVAFESDNRAAWLNAAGSGHAASLSFVIGPQRPSSAVRYYSIDPPVVLGLYAVFQRAPSAALRALLDAVAKACTGSTASDRDG